MKKSFKDILIIAVSLSLVLCTLAACGVSSGREISSIEQLNDSSYVIGVPLDTNDSKLIAEEFPNAQIKHFPSDLNGYTALGEGKIDAFAGDKLAMQIALKNGLKGIRLLDGSLGSVHVCAPAVSPVSKVPDLLNKINAFLDEIESSGVKDEMIERLLINGEEKMADISLPESSDIHLRVGTTGCITPYTYYVGTELCGYDIELANRFAAWLGATIEFKVYDYDGIVPAALSGDVDCVFANLYVTPEREEIIEFSNPTYIGEIGVAVQDKTVASGNKSNENAGKGETPNAYDFNNSRIAILTGTNFLDIVSNELPDAQQIIFNTVPDMVEALESGKVDAIALDEPVARNIVAERDGVRIAEGTLDDFSLAYIFNKSEKYQALCDELSEYLRSIKEDGTIQNLQSKWFDSVTDRSMMSVDIKSLPDTNGTLKIVTISYPPFSMFEEGDFFGYDIEILALFCKEKGYKPEITEINQDAVISAIQAEKFDLGACSAAITEERQELINFSEPGCDAGVVLLIAGEKNTEGISFIENVISSFEKTFIRENRYKLFLQGILMTIIIASLSALFGTLLGFVIFMLCRHGNRAANGVAKVFGRLMEGLPVVVLLMILYYIVFSRVDISGVAVSVIAFTMTFGAEVYAMINSAVATVDIGQTEAAYSLGYTDRKAFFRFILPQALPHFLPAYRSSLVSLIKATAVVGYIAVQDLTKMADIVRSRTYDAFFPLIAVAIIYYIIARLMVFAVNKITLGIDPERRKKEDVLKGVDTHD